MSFGRDEAMTTATRGLMSRRKTSSSTALLPSACALVVALLPAPAGAMNMVIDAGGSLTLKNDLVLPGDDVLEIKGTAAKRCKLRGNGYRIRSKGKWTGSVRIRYCDIH